MDKKKKLDFILNGINDGQSLKEIGSYLGITKQAVSSFLKTNWKRVKKRSDSLLV